MSPPRRHKRPPLKKRMKAALDSRRQFLLGPLRLIHPEHSKDSTYKECYERFFRATGITCSTELLKTVARMRPPLRTLLQYKKKGFGTQTLDDQENEDCIEKPSKECMQRMNDIVNTLRPMPLFEDDSSRDVAEETLLNSDPNFYQVVELD